MGKLVDRTGHRYGMLTVIERDLSKPSAAKGRRVYWICRCDCGRIKAVTGHDLQAGDVQSCGCARHALIAIKRRRHGHAPARDEKSKPTPTYRSWQAAKQRCHSPTHSAYPRYGAHGITMCKKWRESFEAFLADMGERPPGTTLDRIDPARGYEPGNCRWATPKQQAYNSRRTRLFHWKGARLSLPDIARVEDIPRTSLGKRFRALGDINAAVAATKASLKRAY